MQGTAMGMFFLIDGFGNAINLALTHSIDPSKHDRESTLNYYLITGIGGVGIVTLALALIIILEKKWRLGLDRI